MGTKKRRSKKKACRLQSTCFYCKVPLTNDVHRPTSRTLDHFIPKSSGGRDDNTNVVACCNKCNGLKGAIPADEFLLMIRHEIPEEQIKAFNKIYINKMVNQ